GVGGHCIAVDPWFIVASNPDQAKLIRTAREVNDYKARYVLKNVLKIASTMQQPTIACLGISFKKDVDDLRESPALMIVNQLAEKTSGKICVVEPHIKKLPTSLSQHKHVSLTNLDDALVSADIVIVLVAHSTFTKEKLMELVTGKLIDAVGLMGKEYDASFAIA
ncbi:MAG: UDP-N-acetyl-D-mannosamine dehydrogenase, partial [uncultured bacterium]